LPKTENKIILITRQTRLGELVARFNTVAQARFYVEHLGADFSDYLAEEAQYRQSLLAARGLLEQFGRVQVVDRKFLPNYLFGAQDLVVAIGQDGLVANTLKYLSGQLVIGVNPDPKRWDGQLLPFRVPDLARIVPEVFRNRRLIKTVTMAMATLNNGQRMYAVNDLFIGPKTHGSARYIIHSGNASEKQSSSGVIVSTGLGATGWLKSLLAGAAGVTHEMSRVFAKADKWALPVRPEKIHIPWDTNYLCYTVREPFPTSTSGATLVFGKVTRETPLVLHSLTAENAVIFSDGMENDFLEFTSGSQATITIADRAGALVV